MHTSIPLTDQNRLDALAVILGKTASGIRHTASFIYSIFIAIRDGLPELVAWTILIPLLITLGLVATVIMFPMSALIAYGCRKMADDVVSKVGLKPEAFRNRDMMIFLRKIESFREKTEQLLESGASFYVFRPLNIQFEKVVNQCKRIEAAMGPVIYPSATFNIEQANELSEKLKSFESDWSDKSMEVYN